MDSSIEKKLEQRFRKVLPAISVLLIVVLSTWVLFSLVFTGNNFIKYVNNSDTELLAEIYFWLLSVFVTLVFLVAILDFRSDILSRTKKNEEGDKSVKDQNRFIREMLPGNQINFFDNEKVIYTTQRLEHYIVGLQKLAGRNLFYGAAVAIFGVVILVLALVGFMEKSDNDSIQLAEFGTRAVTAAFIQTSAFFFFNMYRSILNDIKYYQNELTNIELKLFALKFSKDQDNGLGIEQVLNALANTERNFILKKGERVATPEEWTSVLGTSSLEKTVQKMVDRAMGNSAGGSS